MFTRHPVGGEPGPQGQVLSQAPNPVNSSLTVTTGLPKLKNSLPRGSPSEHPSPGGCVGAWALGRRASSGHPRDGGPGRRPLLQGGPPAGAAAAGAGVWAGREAPFRAAAASARRSCGEGREGSWTRRRFMGLSGEQVLPRAAPLSRRLQWGCCSRRAGSLAARGPARAPGPRGGAGHRSVVRLSARPSARPAAGAGSSARASGPAHDPRAPPECTPRLTCARGRARSSLSCRHRAPPGPAQPLRRRVPDAHTGA